MAYTVEAEADDASTTTFGFNLALVEAWRTQVRGWDCIHAEYNVRGLAQTAMSVCRSKGLYITAHMPDANIIFIWPQSSHLQ